MPEYSPLPDFTRWPSFPFEGDMRVKRLTDPVEVEPPRSGEDAADCVACNTPDDAYIWVSERWRVRAMDRPTGLPIVLILECRSHLDLGDLPNLLAAELGVMTVRLERAIRSLDGVARVHVNRWGDGSAHLHMWFLARPYGRLQLRGTFLSLWDDILPVIPEEQWRENLALVAAWLGEFGGRAIAEPAHIQWQSPSTFSNDVTPSMATPDDDSAASPDEWEVAAGEDMAAAPVERRGGSQGAGTVAGGGDAAGADATATGIDGSVAAGAAYAGNDRSVAAGAAAAGGDGSGVDASSSGASIAGGDGPSASNASVDGSDGSIADPSSGGGIASAASGSGGGSIASADSDSGSGSTASADSHSGGGSSGGSASSGGGIAGANSGNPSIASAGSNDANKTSAEAGNPDTDGEGSRADNPAAADSAASDKGANGRTDESEENGRTFDDGETRDLTAYARNLNRPTASDTNSADGSAEATGSSRAALEIPTQQGPRQAADGVAAPASDPSPRSA